MMQEPAELQPTHARWELVANSPLPPIYTRNFRIHDLSLESAPSTTYSQLYSELEPQGLAAIPSHVLDDLPTDCRTAFEEAASEEAKWQGKWLSESRDGQRAHFLPSVEWFPK